MKEATYTEQLIGEPVVGEDGITVPVHGRIYVRGVPGVVDEIAQDISLPLAGGLPRGEQRRLAIEAAKNAAAKLVQDRIAAKSKAIAEALQSEGHKAWLATRQTKNKPAAAVQ